MATNSSLQQVIDCAAGGCSVGESQSKSYTIGFSVTGASKGGFFSGGFSVSETWTTGKSYTCNGVPNDDVCLWYNTAHTACKSSVELQSLAVHRLIRQRQTL
jgi:hypothetical protein